MCDTLFSPAEFTINSAALFAKNSDRQRNEAQIIEITPRRSFKVDERLRCTYLTIPQATHAHSTLVCRPFWMWGAEMGSNEHGVTIGNEALYSKIAPCTQKALLGMDLVRLALERSVCASEAVKVITDLLSHYGQGGNCGLEGEDYYHNGFVIVDGTEGFVLETIDRDWVVTKAIGPRSLSNAYSIGDKQSKFSSGYRNVIEQLLPQSEPGEGNNRILADPSMETRGQARKRFARSSHLLNEAQGKLSPSAMMQILRDHGSGDDAEDWNPQTSVSRTICMHSSTNQRPGQTTGAMVSELGKTNNVHWVTGTSATCTSVFRPIFIDTPAPLENGQLPTGQFNDQALWWRHESLHRAALLRNFPQFLNDYGKARDALEADFISEIGSVAGESAEMRSRMVVECWGIAKMFEETWIEKLSKLPIEIVSKEYMETWKQMNVKVGFANNDS